MNILQINQLNKNLISSILPDTIGFNITYQDKLPDTITDDIIIIGICDSGENIDIDKLIQARNNGKTIIFTHSNPALIIEDKNEDETEEDYSKRQNEYLKKLKDNFGIDEIQNTEYIFYNNVVVKHNSFISTLPSKFNIQETHSFGIVLSNKCNIVINNPKISDGQSNYYLAIFEEINKGKVIFWNIGHCNYDRKDIKNLTEIEKQILVELIK